MPFEDHSNFYITAPQNYGSIARVNNGIGEDSGDVKAQYGWAYAHVTDSPFGSEQFWAWYFIF